MPGRPLTRASQQIIESLTTTDEWWEGALDRIACGDSPKAVAEEYAILFGVFMRWIEAEPERRSAYDAALRIATEGHAHDCIAIADEQKEAERRDGSLYDPDVGRDKLRIETRLKLAGKWDRARYGEVKTDINVNIGGSLIAVLSSIDAAPAVLPEPGRVIEHGPVDAADAAADAPAEPV